MTDVERYILMPVLNRQTSFFRSSVLEFTDSIRIKTIDDAHFGSILEQAPDRYRYSINSKTKCVYVNLSEEDDAEKQLREASVLIRFAMNFLGEGGPLIFSFGMHAEKRRKLRILKLFDIPTGTERQDLDKISFKIGQPNTPDEVRKYYGVLQQAAIKKPALLLALNRINWFIAKDNFEDRVIDLTIGLESLIPGKDELRYRFALYLAFITEANPENRTSVFRLFRALYDTRSRIVHGGEMTKDDQKTEDFVRDQFEVIHKLALSAISYYLYFLATQAPPDWPLHLQGLVLANEARAVD